MNMNTVYTRVITAGLLIGLSSACGCDPADHGESLEPAELEPGESAAPSEANIVIVSDEEAFTEDAELAQEFDLADAADASEGPPGKCCYAECYDGVSLWYQLPWISTDCNGKATAWCASHGWGLKDAEWLWC